MPQTKTKYNSRKTEYNGVLYDSKKEAEFAECLDWRLRAHDLKSWSRQVPFPIVINGIKCFSLILDFEVINNDGSHSYYDVKGYKKGDAYARFTLKKKCVEAMYNIKIEEV